MAGSDDLNNANQIKALDNEHIAQTYGRFDVVLSHGKGCQVWDFDGKRYLDMTSGIGVNSFGFCDDEWRSAIINQLGKLQHTSNLYFTEPSVRLANLLTQKSGLQKAFFCNSGTEANECVIKTARKYSHDKYGAGRHTILTLENSFHGRTLASLSATGQASFHQHFMPFVDGFEFLPANDSQALAERIAQGGVCAVLLEVVQGEGGLNALNGEYLAAVQQLCNENDVLFCVDEVQTGIGRTGNFLAYQAFGLSPDVVSLAKGLGGGLPIGAALFGEKCQNTLGKGEHGSTFGANPVVCAGAVSVVERLNDDFLQQVAQKGQKLANALSALPKVKSVAGMGLMIGVEFDDGITASDVVAKGIEKGVLFLTAKHKLRLLPPLIVSDDEIDEAVGVLGGILGVD